MQRITWLVYIGIHLFAAVFVVGVRCANPSQDKAGNCLPYHQPEFLATKDPKKAGWLSRFLVALY